MQEQKPQRHARIPNLNPFLSVFLRSRVVLDGSVLRLALAGLVVRHIAHTRVGGISALVLDLHLDLAPELVLLRDGHLRRLARVGNHRLVDLPLLHRQQDVDGELRAVTAHGALPVGW